MKQVLTAEQMKACDTFTIEQLEVPSIVLMERAALACYRVLVSEFPLENTVVLCGGGNNGGDGLAIARLLKEQGYPATVVFLGKEERMSPESTLQLHMARNYEIPVISSKEAISKIKGDEYTTIVDGLLGIGFSGTLRAPYEEVILAVNRSNASVLAVDIASGVDANTGAVETVAVQADVTVTFGFLKRGQLLFPGKTYTGRLQVADIGITNRSLEGAKAGFHDDVALCLEAKDAAQWMPPRREDSNKGTYGKVLTIAGSEKMYGAAYLSGMASYRVGCGLVQIFTAKQNMLAMQQMLPEAILTTYDTTDSKESMLQIQEQVERAMDWATVICIGPGLSQSPCSRMLVKQALSQQKMPVVADADALNVLAEHKDWLKESKAPVIVTPHMMEMARLTGSTVSELKQYPIDAAKAFAKEYHCICVLKDAATVVAAADGRCSINTSGNNGMSTGGSGDVLSGMIAGLLAQHTEPFEAAVCGVYLHGAAGDRAAKKEGPHSLLARELLREIPSVIQDAIGNDGN